MRFPNSVDDLIRALDERYPEPIADPGDDPEQFLRKAIQRAVILDIKQWRESAHRRPFEGEPKPRGKGRNVRS